MRKKRDKEEEDNLTLLMKQVGERAGLTLEEMRSRYNQFLSQTAKLSITDEELDKKTREFLETISKGRKKKTKPALKVTVAFNDEEAKRFYAIKGILGAKSNAAVLRKLLNSYKVS
ncbi:hypothetical protein MUP01_00045 [Candidatus Bathyarchaeota archaeon]|nr:hypothetical protein [Candidatus Bathyarchaeota archaeon]